MRFQDENGIFFIILKVVSYKPKQTLGKSCTIDWYKVVFEHYWFSQTLRNFRMSILQSYVALDFEIRNLLISRGLIIATVSL